jgi:indolepyruvate ferredoxin oxidoreductase
VTVLGGAVRKGAGIGDIPQALKVLPEPQPPVIKDGGSYCVLVGGVGGTGVVTIGALLGMAPTRPTISTHHASMRARPT